MSEPTTTTGTVSPVQLTREGAVATVTLQRPEGMNALTVAAKLALRDALEEVAGDPDVRAVVLTGSGRAFCVGQDLKEHVDLLQSGDPAPLSTVKEHYNPVVTLIATMPKPVVAAINGTAAGAGLGLAAACDLRVGAAGARYTTAFVGVGLTADSGLSWTLPRLVGAGAAAELLLLGEPFTSERAFELGFLHRLVAPEEVLPTAAALAARLAAGPTVAYAAMKESLAFGSEHGLVATLAKEDELQTRAGASQDHRIAVESFLAKTAAVFTGR